MSNFLFTLRSLLLSKWHVCFLFSFPLGWCVIVIGYQVLNAVFGVSVQCYVVQLNEEFVLRTVSR